MKKGISSSDHLFVRTKQAAKIRTFSLLEIGSDYFNGKTS